VWVCSLNHDITTSLGFGLIASSRRKISGENTGRLMVPPFSEYHYLVKRKCELGISKANTFPIREFSLSGMQKLTRNSQSRESHTFMAKSSFLSRGNTMLRSNLNFPSSKQGDRIAHCFFWVAERNRQPIAFDCYQDIKR
jgi:hypothetical protein